MQRKPNISRKKTVKFQPFLRPIGVTIHTEGIKMEMKIGAVRHFIV